MSSKTFDQAYAYIERDTDHSLVWYLQKTSWAEFADNAPSIADGAISRTPESSTYSNFQVWSSALVKSNTPWLPRRAV